jgi:two-component system KDP operon response regulator KdpE
MMTSKKILIVDDDKDVLLALSVRLTAYGYQILGAPDAATAILRVAQEKPDLILLDLGLPDSNGFVVMNVVKQLSSTANVPVIVISARQLHVYKDAVLLAGAKDYLQKPFGNDDLIRAIQRELVADVTAGAAPLLD